MFKPYIHVVRCGKPEVEGFLSSPCVVQPKLDGTNACVWAEGGEVLCGSRKRQVTPDDDNAGFAAWVSSDDPDAESLRRVALSWPGYVFYGEWLPVKGTKLGKSYTVRGKLFLFDVADVSTGVYGDYETLVTMASGYPYIVPLLGSFPDGLSEQELASLAESNTFLLPDGMVGEGVVAKSPAWRDPYGHQAMVKLVRREFLAAKGKPKAATVSTTVEARIVDEYVTASDVSKTVDKMAVEGVDPSSKGYVPQVMSRVFQDLVEEESWDFLKRFKYPVVDYRELRRCCDAFVRRCLGL
jgi:hypothetical protein